MGIRIRFATVGDAAALLEIYRPYVTDTAITFEYDVPEPEEFSGRIRSNSEKYPYLLAEREGEILGYAYAAPFASRAAYGWSVETTIYLAETARGMGVGRRLYEALELALGKMHICNLNACIAVPEVDDAHLDHNSVEFHALMGYDMVGLFHRSGYKFGTWYHMVWMEKLIGAHSPNPPAVGNANDFRLELEDIWAEAVR